MGAQYTHAPPDLPWRAGPHTTFPYRACGGRTHPRSGRDAVADVATISRRSRAADGITGAASIAAAASSRATGEAATAAPARAAPTGAGCSARSAARASSLSRSTGRGVATRAVRAAAAAGHRDSEHRERGQPARARKTDRAISHLPFSDVVTPTDK